MPNASATSTEPGTSRRPTRCSARLAHLPLCASTTAAAASGRLMKKIQRHDTHSTSTPPSGGPPSVATLVNAVHSPTARPASSP